MNSHIYIHIYIYIFVYILTHLILLGPTTCLIHSTSNLACLHTQMLESSLDTGSGFSTRSKYIWKALKYTDTFFRYKLTGKFQGLRLLSVSLHLSLSLCLSLTQSLRLHTFTLSLGWSFCSLLPTLLFSCVFSFLELLHSYTPLCTLLSLMHTYLTQSLFIPSLLPLTCPSLLLLVQKAGRQKDIV